MDRDLLEKVRQQFDAAPYPNIPLEKSPQGDFNLLYLHSLVTPYYLRNQKVISTVGKTILDVGCGSGYTSLVLAVANPGAKVIGIDLSEKSTELAKKRLEYHGFKSAEFYPIAVEDIATLDLEFDYISCDELLYLVSDPLAVLQALQSVLKPDGIIRANLHSFYQRFERYRAQKLFGLMGLMESNPEDFEIELAVETMKSLKDGVNLKARTWGPDYEGSNYKEFILMNYLIQGDKGYTIPEVFSLLQAADLEFISMLKWRHWELLDLFKEPNNLPAFWAMGLSTASLEEKLHLFELLHPIHRLIDFWCGHPQVARSASSPTEWDTRDWQRTIIHLHPQLQKEEVQTALRQSIAQKQPFEFSRYLSVPTKTPVDVESSIAAALLPLWEQPQPLSALVERWREIQRVHPETLETKDESKAQQEILEILQRLEAFLYVLFAFPEAD